MCACVVLCETVGAEGHDDLIHLVVELCVAEVLAALAPRLRHHISNVIIPKLLRMPAHAARKLRPQALEQVLQMRAKAFD